MDVKYPEPIYNERKMSKVRILWNTGIPVDLEMLQNSLFMAQKIG